MVLFRQPETSSPPTLALAGASQLYLNPLLGGFVACGKATPTLIRPFTSTSVALADCAATVSIGRKRRKRILNWADLPPELLQLIARKLTKVLDCIRFRSVCSSWRSAARPEDLRLPRRPWLVVPQPPCYSVEISTSLSLFNFLTTKIAYRAEPGEVRAKFIYGSSHGWLLMIGRPSSERIVSLFNPITKVEIPLPELPMELNLGALRNAVLCCHPASVQPGQLLAAAWTCRKLAFVRKGDSEWTLVDCLSTGVSGILYFEEKLYAIDSGGRLAVLQVESSTLNLLVHPRPPEVQLPSSFRLMEADGDLLLLAWYSVGHEHSDQFDVYKLDRSDKGKLSWARIGTTPNFRRRNIRFVCAEVVPCHKGYRIYLALDPSLYKSKRMYSSISVMLHGCSQNPDAACIQVIDVDSCITFKWTHFWEEPKSSLDCRYKRTRYEWMIPRGVTWMVPSLH